MPEIYGRPWYIKTLIEKTLLVSGNLRLIQKNDLTNLKTMDEAAKTFDLREYEIILDGKPTELKIKFIYDYVNNKASVKFRDWHLVMLNIALDKVKPKEVPSVFVPKNNIEWIKQQFKP